MLFTISTDYHPATDLGFLLHKHPDKLQTFHLSFGEAHVFYPEASESICTAALLLDIDPITLFRNQRRINPSGFALKQYINDRPYVASSFLSVAISRVYGSALAGTCNKRPDLVDQLFPLTARIHVVNCREGAEIVERLFSPLKYKVNVLSHPLSVKFPEWEAGDIFTLELFATTTLKTLLTHLYVLIPVLDDDKHYFVGEDEIAKLLDKGEGWLATHPDCELITKRYLHHQRNLTRSALELLREDDAQELKEPSENKDDAIEKNTQLNQLRLQQVYSALKMTGARRVVDLGCGEGKLLKVLLPDEQFTEILGMDVSNRILARAERFLRTETLPDNQRVKLKLIQGSLNYRDHRLEGYEAAVLMEVIEHLEPARLNVMEQIVFGSCHPDTIIITTPNQEYNRLWPSLSAGVFRHPEHRFEWTRNQFKEWTQHISETYSYKVVIQPIGAENEDAGAPTQMAIFNRVTDIQE
jgi:3' terminal RNA ribose 2'-O-methyltransferase Hen1